MSQPGKNTEATPTQRLLEYIRGNAGSEHAEQYGHEAAPASSRRRRSISFAGKAAKPVQLGVDIGSGLLKIAGSVHTKGTTTLSLWEVHDFPYELHSEDMPGRLRDVLSPAFDTYFKSPAKQPQLWVSYEFSREEFYVLTLPAVKNKDLPATLSWTLQRSYDADLKNSVLDFEVLGEVNEKNVRKLQILAVLIVKAEVDRLHEVFSLAGFPLAGITPSGLADVNLFRSGCIAPPVPNIGIVHIGRDSSRIELLSHTNLVLHRKIRTGMQTILEDAPQTMESDNEEPAVASGERRVLDLLLTPDREGPVPGTEEIIAGLEPGMDRLIRQVERTLSYHTRNLGHHPIQRIYLSGRLSAVSQIQTRFGQSLGLEVKPMDAMAGNVTLGVPQPGPLAERLELSTAVGLSLSSFDRTLNLVHTFAQKTRSRTLHRARLAGIALTAGLLFCLGAYYTWQLTSLHARQQSLHSVQTHVRQVHSRIDELKSNIKALQGDMASRGRPHAALSLQTTYSNWRHYATRFKPVAYLGEIFSLLPENVRLQDVFLSLLDQGTSVSVALKQARDPASSAQLVYTDRTVDVTLHRAPAKNAQSDLNFQQVLMLKGTLAGTGYSLQMQLSKLEKTINSSPFFQVVDSIVQEKLSSTLGPGLQFHLLLKIT